MKTPTGIRKGGSLSRSTSRSAGRSFWATGMFLKEQLWVWPLIAAALLAALGLWLRETVDGVVKAQMAEDLRVLLQADVEALRLAFQAHQALVQIAADDPRVRALAVEIAATPGRDPAALLRSPKLAELREVLRPWMERYEYDGFLVLDRSGLIVAAKRDALIGTTEPAEASDFIAQALSGRATVSRPFPSLAIIPDLDGTERSGVPTMFAAAPLRDEAGRPVAVLGLRMAPELVLSRILGITRRGASGETYAFDRAGRLVSPSRFDEDLKRIGLLADQPHVRSTLNLELRDPGVDMTTGGRPAQRRGEQPLTRMAAEAVRGRDGVDVAGYRDYRGVPVLGAWTWLPEYGLGIATEIDRAEAYRPLTIIRTAFWSMFGLLGAAAVAIFVFTVLMARLRLKMQTAALAARQLGSYTLEEKIGEGGMGSVYRAHHAMLRRPTAVKLLAPEKTDAEALARFEREVQLTSQLNHPNTITIFDYGRTPEGIFYYAMEYLDGISLEDLVARFGPVPDGRVVAILRQACGSLAEAHAAGLIHRDIKPANILLTRRGGLFDFVKVLDFGLVKPVGDVGVTAAGTVTGTPLYVAPETIEHPGAIDSRADLYALGAVGYFLLTGTPVFPGPGLMDLLRQHLATTPEPPTVRLGRALSPRLEALILRCLAKDPQGRPPTAAAVVAALAQCDVTRPWTEADSESWWRAAEAALRGAPAGGAAAATVAVAEGAAGFETSGFNLPAVTLDLRHRGPDQ